MITHHLLLARKHGEKQGYPIASSYGDAREVLAKYKELVSQPALAEFKKEHAELILLGDGKTIHHHNFENPATVERRRKDQVLADALRIDGENEKAKNDLKAASKAADTARAAVRSLSPEQADLLKAHKDNLANIAAKLKTAGDSKVASDAEAKEQSEQAAAESKRLREVEALRANLLNTWAQFPDETLVKLAEEKKAVLSKDVTRPQIITALLEAFGASPAVPPAS